MDERTLQGYAIDAPRLTALYRSVHPERLYEVMRTFFHKGKATADIGCGSGRDTAWLIQEGYAAVGFDGAPAMLEQARAAYPQLKLHQATLPELTAIPTAAFDNVLCAATLMHIPREHLITAVFSLARILKPGGRLTLTYRQSQSDTEREVDGRLFTAIPTGKLILLMEAVGLQVLETFPQADTHRPDVTWTVLVAEKSVYQAARGLERVQSVLAQDKKDATYKFALLRALCAISRSQPHIVRWGASEVFVPLWAIAVQWLTYYWPFLTSPTFIAQKRGEGPGALKPIAFRSVVSELSAAYGPDGLYALMHDLDEHPDRYRRVIKKIADTIRDGPVYYSGTNAQRLFQHYKRPLGDASHDQLGYVQMPESIWLDITRFGHWIEDSLVLRWAQLTVEMNQGSTVGEVLPLLLGGVGDERETGSVRTILNASEQPLACVWSGSSLDRGYEVDHVIPYAAWGNNSMWNLLPALPKVNNQKRDALPTRQLLLRRRDCIIEYWRLYHRTVPTSFQRQVNRSLGLVAGEPRWESIAFAGLQEAVERVAATRGLRRWEP